MIELASYKKKLDSLLARYHHLQQTVREEKKKLQEAKEHLAHVEEARKLVQGIAKTTQEAAHRQIASVVSRCLEAVFGEDAYQFRINFHEKRGRTEAELVLVKEGLEMDPLSAAAGGAVDISSLALRIACLCLSTPRRRKLLVLDEPLKNIHGKENRERAAALILSLAKDFSLQIIMVTGLEWLKIGKVVDVEEMAER